MRVIFLFFLFLFIKAHPPRRRQRSTWFSRDILYDDSPVIQIGPLPPLPLCEGYICRGGDKEKASSSGRQIPAIETPADGLPYDYEDEEMPEYANEGTSCSNGRCSKDTDKKSEEHECYFHKERKSPLEQGERPKHSKVSQTCEGDLTKMSDLVNGQVATLHEAQNPLDLILCRGAGECALDFDDTSVIEKWSDKYICRSHQDELLEKWRQKKYRHIAYKKIGKHTEKEVCTMTNDIGNFHTEQRSPQVRSVQKYYLNKREAHAILEQDKLLFHAGIPICANHKKYAMSAFSQDHLQDRGYYPDPPPKDGFLSHSTDIDTESHNSCKVAQNDPEYHPPRLYVPSKMSDVPQETQDAFFQFASSANENRMNTKKPFKELSTRSKNRKAKSVSNLLDTTCAIVAPDAPEALKMMVMRKNSQEMWTMSDATHIEVSNVMNQVARLFFRAQSKSERLAVLSVVAAEIPLNTMHQWIPGLSTGLYYEARKLQKIGIVHKDNKRCRYEPELINLFVEFISSNAVVSTHTFGTKFAKLDSGERIEIPNHTRKQGATEIIEMFLLNLKQNNMEDKAMSKSTYYKILEICPAGKQTAITCVDYFLADALEANDDLVEIVDRWRKQGKITSERHKELVHGIDESLHYYRTDFRIHLKPVSRTGDHCMTYALSDPENTAFQSKCSHNHNVKCDRCEFAKSFHGELMDQAKYFIETMEEDAENDNAVELASLTDDLAAINENQNKLLEFKKHVLRSRYTDDFRTETVANLKEGEALITLDFAQKLLPMKRYETQKDYFGKRGMSYHVSHVIANISYHFVTHSMVHILEDESQDNQVVTSIIHNVLNTLRNFDIHTVTLRSDNAGCYHSVNTIMSMPKLSHYTKVQVVKYAFSEPQNGKGSCDRVASQVKRKVRQYVDSGHDVTTTKEFFTALTARNPLKGTSIYLSEVGFRKDKKESTKAKKIPQMSLLYDFEFNGNTITARRYDKIGDGIQFRVEDESPFVNGARLLPVEIRIGQTWSIGERDALEEKRYDDLLFWSTGKCEKAACLEEETTKEDEIESVDTPIKPKNDDEVFRCPEVGCSSSFLYFGSLERHLELGKHNIAPERITLRDYVLHLFLNKLEDFSPRTETIPAIANMIGSIDDADPDELIPKEEGWGLKVNKKNGKFPEHVRSFLLDVFDEGIAQKCKKTGKEVAERMKTLTDHRGNRVFSTEDRLTARQIDSFFSREAQARRMASVTTESSSRPKRHVQEQSGVFLQEYENEYSFEYQLQYLKDPTTPSLDWMIWEAIHREKHNIFFMDDSTTPTTKRQENSNE